MSRTGTDGLPRAFLTIAASRRQADFSSRGLTNVTSVDVDPSIRAVYGSNGAAPTDPASAAFATYYGNYHGTYEPPLCHLQARALFDTLK